MSGGLGPPAEVMSGGSGPRWRLRPRLAEASGGLRPRAETAVEPGPEAAEMPGGLGPQAETPEGLKPQAEIPVEPRS